MQQWRFPLFTMALLAWCGPVLAQVDEASLREQVLTALKEEFSDAVLKPRDGGGFQFWYKTREFVLYGADKTGEWQPPHAAIGPDRGGFMVEFVITPEPWDGALMIPSAITEDFYVFQHSHVIMESKDGRSHIWSSINNPRNKGHSQLRDKLMRIFYAFDGELLPQGPVKP